MGFVRRTQAARVGTQVNEIHKPSPAAKPGRHERGEGEMDYQMALDEMASAITTHDDDRWDYGAYERVEARRELVRSCGGDPSCLPVHYAADAFASWLRSQAQNPAEAS